MIAPQVLSQTTAATIAQSIITASIARLPALTRFSWRLRLVTSDRYSAQLAAEVGVQSARKDWSLLNCACEVHKCAGSLSKALKAMDAGISGMIRLQLCLRLGGWTKVFRKCLMEEVSATLEVLEMADDTRDVRQYRVLAVSVFMSVGPRRKFVQSILSFLPNGNLQLHDRVQVTLSSAASVSRSTLALLVAKGLCLRLASANLLVFNRSRWAKNDESLGQLGLLQACHGLLKRVYKRWLVAVGHTATLFGADPRGRATSPR